MVAQRLISDDSGRGAKKLARRPSHDGGTTPNFRPSLIEILIRNLHIRISPRTLAHVEHVAVVIPEGAEQLVKRVDAGRLAICPPYLPAATLSRCVLLSLNHPRPCMSILRTRTLSQRVHSASTLAC